MCYYKTVAVFVRSDRSQQQFGWFHLFRQIVIEAEWKREKRNKSVVFFVSYGQLSEKIIYNVGRDYEYSHVQV